MLLVLSLKGSGTERMLVCAERGGFSPAEMAWQRVLKRRPPGLFKLSAAQDMCIKSPIYQEPLLNCSLE